MSTTTEIVRSSISFLVLRPNKKTRNQLDEFKVTDSNSAGYSSSLNNTRAPTRELIGRMVAALRRQLERKPGLSRRKPVALMQFLQLYNG